MTTFVSMQQPFLTVGTGNSMYSSYAVFGWVGDGGRKKMRIKHGIEKGRKLASAFKKLNEASEWGFSQGCLVCLLCYANDSSITIVSIAHSY